MKKLRQAVMFAACVLLLGGCASLDPAAPRDEREAMPERNQDPRWGLLINEGQAYLDMSLFDEANRLVERIYVSGANRSLEIGGRNVPHYVERQLEFGNYRLEIFPFYYRTDGVGWFVGWVFRQNRPFRYRVDLPKQVVGFTVGRNPTAQYDYGYPGIGGTFRHWGWITRLNGGAVQDGLPLGITITLPGF